MKKLQLLLIPSVVINGFCYPFSKALLEKLKTLVAEDMFFEDTVEDRATTSERRIREGGRNNTYTVAPIARTVLSHLQNQLGSSIVSDTSPYSPLEIEQVIALGEEFLSIFQKK